MSNFHQFVESCKGEPDLAIHIVSELSPVEVLTSFLAGQDFRNLYYIAASNSKALKKRFVNLMPRKPKFQLKPFGRTKEIFEKDKDIDHLPLYVIVNDMLYAIRQTDDFLRHLWVYNLNKDDKILKGTRIAEGTKMGVHIDEGGTLTVDVGNSIKAVRQGKVVKRIDVTENEERDLYDGFQVLGTGAYRISKDAKDSWIVTFFTPVAKKSLSLTERPAKIFRKGNSVLLFFQHDVRLYNLEASSGGVSEPEWKYVHGIDEDIDCDLLDVGHVEPFIAEGFVGFIKRPVEQLPWRSDEEEFLGCLELVLLDSNDGKVIGEHRFPPTTFSRPEFVGNEFIRMPIVSASGRKLVLIYERGDDYHVIPFRVKSGEVSMWPPAEYRASVGYVLAKRNLDHDGIHICVIGNCQLRGRKLFGQVDYEVGGADGHSSVGFTATFAINVGKLLVATRPARDIQDALDGAFSVSMVVRSDILGPPAHWYTSGSKEKDKELRMNLQAVVRAEKSKPGLTAYLVKKVGVDSSADENDIKRQLKLLNRI